MAAALALVALGLRRARAPDFHDRVVLITGGSRGLGRELAREFGHAGANVVVCARNPADLAETAAMLEREGVDARTIPADVTDRSQVERLVEQAVAWRGRLDMLVANAGTMAVGPLDVLQDADFEHAMDVMFWGVFHPVRIALPHLEASDRPRIAVITSIGGKLPAPHLIPYTSAKHAAVGFAETLRTELAGRVPVTTVVPGLMRTGSHVNALFKGDRSSEHRWFGTAASLPLISVSAERAARLIARAVNRGDAELTISAAAHLATRAHGLMPGVSTRIAGLVARALPDAAADGDASQARLGRDIPVELGVPGTLGRQAANDHQPSEE